VQRDPDKQAPAPPPTLRNPGETLPQDSDKNNAGVMKPVHFPKPQPDDYPDASKRGQQQEGGQQSAGQQKQDASAPGQPVPASSSGGPPAAGPQNPQPATPAPQATTIGGNPDSQ
jgi:hypothetical protein